MITLQERAQLPKAEILQQFIHRQNAALRNFLCGFETCYPWWLLKKCIYNAHFCMKGLIPSAYRHQKDPVSVPVVNLQYHECSLNTQIMNGVTEPSSTSLTTYFHFTSTFVLELPFGSLWLVEPNC